MLRENNKILQDMQRVWDGFLTAASFCAAYVVKKYWLPEPWQGLSTEPNYYALLLLCLIIWHVVFKLTDVYRPYRKQYFLRVALNVIRSIFISVMVLALVIFLFKEQALSRIFLGLFFFLNAVFLVGSKWGLYTVLLILRKRGYNSRNVLIVGCGSQAIEIAKYVEKRPGAGFLVIGCLSVGNDVAENYEKEAGMPVIGDIADIHNILTTHVVDELLFAVPLRKIPNAAQYISAVEEMGVYIHLVPEWGLQPIGFTPKVSSLCFEDGFGLPTLALTTTPDRNPAISIKAIFDFTSSAIGLIFLLPALLMIAVAIKLSSRGPIFYRQVRMGQNGRLFNLYKFRTMVDGADKIRDELLDQNESDGPVFKIQNDPRVIPYIGTFLRKSSLDELPQLINVVKGDMSLVGPRPPIPEEVIEYSISQRRRLSMKPGITCLWQTAPRRNEINFQEWVRMDLQYIDQWSLWLDFKILVRTVGVVLTGEGR
ncbi:MAG: sugar transferase [Anaerolineaceae bacterium]|nr:sugar transferase [Anaerolineaceae bacterium]